MRIPLLFDRIASNTVFGLVFMLLLVSGGFFLHAAEGDAPGTGPALTDPSKDAILAPGAKTKIDRSQPIDLSKTPWLVESVGATVGSSVFNRDRLLWADPIAFVPNDKGVGPEIVVEHWVGEAPKPENLVGKYIFIECWATWCPPCRRSLPLLKFYQEHFKDDLVVIAICEASKNAEGGEADLAATLEALKKMTGTLKPEEMNFHVAVDTGRRFANKLGVFGIPHAVLIEPTEGVVVWEGMPTWIGYELDDKTLGRYFAIGRKQKEAGKIPEKSPISFVVKPVDPNAPSGRPTVESKYGPAGDCK